jgi:hypothetical protein
MGVTNSAAVSMPPSEQLVSYIHLLGAGSQHEPLQGPERGGPPVDLDRDQGMCLVKDPPVCSEPLPLCWLQPVSPTGQAPGPALCCGMPCLLGQDAPPGQPPL